MIRLFALAPLLAGCTFLVGEAHPGDAAVNLGVDFAAPCDPSQLSSDVRNCGVCGRDCTRLPGVDPARIRCVFGACDLTSACLPARANCSAAEGCETDISIAQTCGGCGTRCGGATPFCVGDATGGFSCSAACGGTTPTLCGSQCVDTGSDPRHCGDCFNACPEPDHSTAFCDLFGCGFECDPGYTPSGNSCVPTVMDMAAPRDLAQPRDLAIRRDMASSDLRSTDAASGDMVPDNRPPCDCSGISACSLSNTCVGPNCCFECTPGFPIPLCGTSCNEDPTCKPSAH